MIIVYQNYQLKLISVLFQFFKGIFLKKRVVVCIHFLWFQYGFSLVGVNNKLTKTCEDVIE